MRPDRHKKTIAPRAVRSPIPGRAVRLAPWFLTLMAAAATTGTRAERLRFDPSLPWEVRRAQPADVILADSPAAWHVQFVNARAPEVRITDHPAGDYRGHVLLGKTVTLPDHVPYHVGLRFRYQTYCALPDRSGQVAFFVFTTRAWDGLGDDPLTRVQFDPSRPPTGVVASAIVHAHGDPVGDCTSWQLYESANLSRDLSDHAGEKVVFAVLWGCYHRGASEWGRLADVQLVTRTREEALERLRARIYSPEFFSHFMLRGKDLAAVKAAVVEGDYLTAGEELVAHFAKRTAPRWHFGRADRPRPTFPAVADGLHAFRALGGGFGLTDRRFGAGSDAQGMGYGDRESCLCALARAYWTTADEKYAREFAAGFVDWYLSRPPSAGGPSWDPDEAAVRVPELISCFHYLQDSDGADGFLRLVMLQSLWEHGQFTLAHKTVGTNAILVQVNALLALASVFPEYQDARTWRDVGNKWLVDALKKQFYPDGACVELSGARQAACLAALHDIRATAALNRVSLPREFTPTMLRATEALMFLMKPDGSVPSTNAGTADAVTEWLSKGGEIFKRDDMKWLASAERKGAPPPAPSESLPYAGWVVMRTGWNPGDRYLFFDAGPYGQGGQHEDGLSIEVYAFGRTLVADPGGADGGDEWG
ncbi:MAG: heparinase II/III family protein, partial [Armatimonadota bacterium]